MSDYFLHQFNQFLWKFVVVFSLISLFSFQKFVKTQFGSFVKSQNDCLRGKYLYSRIHFSNFAYFIISLHNKKNVHVSLHFYWNHFCDSVKFIEHNCCDIYPAGQRWSAAAILISVTRGQHRTLYSRVEQETPWHIKGRGNAFISYILQPRGHILIKKTTMMML